MLRSYRSMRAATYWAWTSFTFSLEGSASFVISIGLPTTTLNIVRQHELTHCDKGNLAIHETKPIDKGQPSSIVREIVASVVLEKILDFAAKCPGFWQVEVHEVVLSKAKDRDQVGTSP